MNKTTEELINELKNNKCDIHKFIKKNASTMINDDITRFWKNSIIKSGMSKSNIINKSDFSYRHFYDVINGRKIPSRDKIIRLVMTMGLDFELCQEALRISGKNALYPLIRRDSIIIYALFNKLSHDNLQELLRQYDEDLLK